MIRTHKILLLLACFFTTVPLFSQQVNGHWYGIGKMQATSDYHQYLSELVLRQKGKQVWGELDYYFRDSLVKVPIKGSFDPGSRKLSILPFSMIYFRSPNARNSIDVNLSGNFTLLVSKTESVLTGSLVPDADHKYTVPEINYRFTRSDDTTDLVMVNEEPVVQKPVVIATDPAPQPAPADDFTKRAKVYTKELELENPSIRLEIYDNGEIDGDMISLYLNDKLVLPKVTLTHKAVRLTIDLDPSLPFNELSMFAENLGTKPPNTAALIVYDGKTRYETLLSSDLSKSATLKLKKKE
ncbi:MAG TPA: hypothetical protein VGE25_12110 [Sediminibacterium sp.]